MRQNRNSTRQNGRQASEFMMAVQTDTDWNYSLHSFNISHFHFLCSFVHTYTQTSTSKMGKVYVCERKFSNEPPSDEWKKALVMSSRFGPSPTQLATAWVANVDEWSCIARIHTQLQNKTSFSFMTCENAYKLCYRCNASPCCFKIISKSIEQGPNHHRHWGGQVPPRNGHYITQTNIFLNIKDT